MAVESTLTITELTSTGKQKRSLQLRGSGLPFRPSDWGGNNNIQTTWYPGNGTEATQQVLGPREGPSAWTGEWRFTRMIHTPAMFAESGPATEGVSIAVPFTLMTVIESILRGGLLLRVTWSQSGPSRDHNATIVREGRAKDWKFSVERAQDIAWSITFDWSSRGRGKQKPIQTREESLEIHLAKYRAAAQRILDEQIINERNRFTAKQAPTRFNIGQLEALAGYPAALAAATRASATQYIAQVQQLVNVIDKAKNAPFALTNGVLQITQDTINSSNRFVDQLGRIPVELTSTRNSARDIVRAVKTFGQNSENSRVFAQESANITAQLRRVISQLALKGQDSTRASTKQSDIIAVHVTKQGETPTTISLKYFNSPDNAIDILRANKLPWYQSSFKLGIPLIIPNLHALTAAQ